MQSYPKKTLFWSFVKYHIEILNPHPRMSGELHAFAKSYQNSSRPQTSHLLRAIADNKSQSHMKAEHSLADNFHPIGENKYLPHGRELLGLYTSVTGKRQRPHDQRERRRTTMINKPQCRSHKTTYTAQISSLFPCLYRLFNN